MARSGAVPLILPTVSDEKMIEAMLENLGGLILTGGDDINPLLYREEPHQKLRNVVPLRDDFEFKLLKCAQKRRLAVLGICRGHQLINVVFGGTLYQDNSLKESSFIRHSQPKGFDFLEHTVDIAEGSWLASFLGRTITINSYHHQSVKDLAKGFKITACARDGIIEAIERIDRGSFCAGVQWHPEMNSDRNESMQQIFNEFTKICAKTAIRQQAAGISV